MAKTAVDVDQIEMRVVLDWPTSPILYCGKKWENIKANISESPKKHNHRNRMGVYIGPAETIFLEMAGSMCGRRDNYATISPLQAGVFCKHKTEHNINFASQIQWSIEHIHVHKM